MREGRREKRERKCVCKREEKVYERKREMKEKKGKRETLARQLWHRTEKRSLRRLAASYVIAAAQQPC